MKIPSASFITFSLASQPRRAGEFYSLLPQSGVWAAGSSPGSFPTEPTSEEGKVPCGEMEKTGSFSTKKPWDFVASWEKAEEFSKPLFFCKLVISHAEPKLPATRAAYLPAYHLLLVLSEPVVFPGNYTGKYRPYNSKASFTGRQQCSCTGSIRVESSDGNRTGYPGAQCELCSTTADTEMN